MAIVLSAVVPAQAVTHAEYAITLGMGPRFREDDLQAVVAKTHTSP
jgi:hypothetical protein